MDPAKYTLREEGEMVAILSMRVDDGVFACLEVGVKATERYMVRLKVRKSATDDFVYTGAKVERGKDGNIHLGQADCIRRLREIELEKGGARTREQL